MNNKKFKKYLVISFVSGLSLFIGYDVLLKLLAHEEIFFSAIFFENLIQFLATVGVICIAFGKIIYIALAGVAGGIVGSVIGGVAGIAISCAVIAHILNYDKVQNIYLHEDK
ncbi:hypothetical protein AN639_03395 [Candidatus Epulonipiscium fishelsonii]|nr:hypothetical protein AN639_03395 [Epulopiscium sp. SCG-B05WGA-EpuloA1]